MCVSINTVACVFVTIQEHLDEMERVFYSLTKVLGSNSALGM